MRGGKAEATEAAGAQASVWALGAAGFGVFLGVYATQPLLPELGRAFGVGKSAIALTVSAPALAIAFLSPLAGLLGPRLGHRRMITLALALLVLPTLLAATSGDLAELVAWRFLQGVLVPGVYVGTLAYIATEWRGGMGRATSAFIAGSVVGSTSGRLVSGTVAGLLGWRASFAVLSGLTALSAVMVRRWLPAGAGGGASALAPPSLRGLRAVVSGRLAATCAVGFALLFTQVAIFTYVTFHLAEPPFGLGPAALGWIFLVYLIGAVVTPVSGRWIDRFGARAVLAGAMLTGASGLALTLVPSTVAVVAGLSACCTATFVGQSAATAYLGVSGAPEHRPLASGLYVSSYYLGGAAGAVLPALAWARAGWTGCVALVLAVQLGTVALALRSWERSGLPGPS